MSVSQEYRTQVAEQLAAVGAIQPRSFFGEVGLYADGLLFGMMVDDALYFKTDETNRADYEAEGIAPFVAPWNPGRITNYYAVPETVLNDSGRLRLWVDKAIAVAARQPKKAKKAKKQ